MKIQQIVWDDKRIEHIAIHGVTPAEVEEVCFSGPLIQRAKGKRRFRVYFARGQTAAGRHLTIVFRHLERGKARVVTARDMTASERRAYRRRVR